MTFEQPEIDAAVAAIADPSRMAAAQSLVARAAPDLQRVLAAALADGGWFDTAHNAAVRDAVGTDDLEQRLRAVKTLFAEETRLSMLVGVAVGLELGRELGYRGDGFDSDGQSSGALPDGAQTRSDQEG